MSDQFQQDLGNSLSSGQVPSLDDLRKQLDEAFGPDAKTSKRTSEKGGFLNSPVFDILGSILTRDPTFALKKQKFMSEMDRIQGQEENAKFDRLKTYIQAREYLENQKPINQFTTQPTTPELAPQQGFEPETGQSFTLPGPTGREIPSGPPKLDLSKLGQGRMADIPKFKELAELFQREGPKVGIAKPGSVPYSIDQTTGKITTGEPLGQEPVKTKTPEMLTEGALKEKLRRQPTNTEIKEEMRQEAKGYDTYKEAWDMSKKMVADAGPDAALLPGAELAPNNKWVPKPAPDISKRIPPFTAVPGMFMTNLNRKTGKYSDPTSGQEITREQGIARFGEGAILQADKTALGELTKREQLISTFTNRIRANVPIVLDAIKDVGNTNPRLLNQGLNASKQYLVGSGKWQALQTAVIALSNEVQRVESNALGIGGQGQEERKMWVKIHDPNMSLKDWKDLSSMILRLGNTAEKAIGDQRKKLSSRFSEDVGLGSPTQETKDPLGIR